MAPLDSTFRTERREAILDFIDYYSQINSKSTFIEQNLYGLFLKTEKLLSSGLQL